MTIESSFIPFPSEIILIPAGILCSIGNLNLFLCIIFGAFASVLGALINYFIGKNLGRAYILKHNKLFFINKKHLYNSEHFFKKYGGITTFVGRLIPVIRQYISIPAGFSNMNLFKFSIFTFLGAFIWSAFLVFIGYFFAENANNLLSIYNHFLLIIIAIFLIIVLLVKIFYKRLNIKKT
jgi:membrane protein DedA with SNARE-associated domain